MQKYHDSVLNETGTPAAGVSVLVSLFNGGVATIYSDNGVTEASNPLTTNSLGYFEFYGADGRYTLTISGSGIETINITDVLLEDPQDGSAMVIDGGTISDSAISGGTVTDSALSNITIDGVAVAGSDIAKYSRLNDADGADLIGFSYAVSYAAGTIGKWLKDLATSVGSAFIGFIQSGTGAVARTVEDELRAVVRPQQFGAVGDGVADDTAAFQKALDTGRPVSITEGTFRLTAALTATQNLNLRGYGRAKSMLVWDAGASSGIQFTCTGSDVFVHVEGIAFKTKGVGVGVGLTLDFSGMTTGGSLPPRAFVRDNEFQGSAGRTQGWLTGIDIISPLNVYVEENHIIGCWVTDLLTLLTETGISIRRGSGDASTSAHVSGNTVITCQNGCLITDVEGQWISENDFQACDYPLTCQNLVQRRTQVRIFDNHLGATYTSLTLKGVHHFKVVANELYRHDTDAAATASILIVQDSQFGVIEGNTLRCIDTAIVTHGIQFIRTESLVGVTTIAANMFFQLHDQVIASPTNMRNIYLDDNNIFHSPQGDQWGISVGSMRGVSTPASTTPTTLATNSFYPGSFQQGKSLVIEAAGIFANTTTVKTVELKVGSTTICQLTGTIKNGLWAIKARVGLTVDNLQRYIVQAQRTPTTTEVQPGTDNTTNATVATTTATPVISFLSRGNLAEDLTADIAVSVVGTNGTANAGDITCTYFRLGWERE